MIIPPDHALAFVADDCRSGPVWQGLGPLAARLVASRALTHPAEDEVRASGDASVPDATQCAAWKPEIPSMGRDGRDVPRQTDQNRDLKRQVAGLARRLDRMQVELDQTKEALRAATIGFSGRADGQAVGPAAGPPQGISADSIWSELSLLIDARLADHAAGQAKALQRRFDAGMESRLKKAAPRLFAVIEPMVQRSVKHKNDVQDDAIIGIGAKVDAQDAAILDLVGHVRSLLNHPLFRL